MENVKAYIIIELYLLVYYFSIAYNFVENAKAYIIIELYLSSFDSWFFMFDVTWGARNISKNLNG